MIFEHVILSLLGLFLIGACICLFKARHDKNTIIYILRYITFAFGLAAAALIICYPSRIMTNIIVFIMSLIFIVNLGNRHFVFNVLMNIPTALWFIRVNASQNISTFYILGMIIYGSLLLLYDSIH